MSDKTQTVSFSAEGAQRVQADLCINVGQLHVEGGAAKVMEGEFTCSVEEWQPDVQYRVEDGVGQLSVIQPDVKKRGYRWRVVNDWDVAFSNNMPLDLVAEINAGTAELALSDLAMRELDVEINSGTLDVTLRGDHPLLKRADFEINAGRVDVNMNGHFPRLTVVDLEMNATKATLDFTGEWTDDVDIAIEANAGWMRVLLPRNIGVQVHLENSLTLVKHPGLKRRKDRSYTNEAFGKSEVTLHLDIEANVGKLDLELVDKITVTQVV